MLERLDIQSVVPYPSHHYEWVTGVATFAVDPRSPANARIVDLDAVATDGDGKVRFESDVRLLRPVDTPGDRVIQVIPNRGMLMGLPFSLDTAMSFNSTAPDPGDGFLLDKGWTIAWCGWQWDVSRDDGLLGLTAPMADVTPGPIRVEFRPDVDEESHSLSDSSAFFNFTPYPVSDADDPAAVLTVRTTPRGEPTVVPRHEWHFKDATQVSVTGGFRAFHWYQLIFRPTIAPVVGTGLLAARDFGSYLHQSYNYVFSFGVSQSGRFLREFIYTGLNLDEAGAQVFDGVFSHIASARRGEFNMRGGQPSLTHPLTPGYGPPYDTTSLLDCQRSVGASPKVFFTNSSWEYWRGDGALVHQDPTTGADLAEDRDGRAYLISGTDHYGKVPGLKELLPVANPAHDLDAGPILRALFVQLEDWVCDAVTPEPSRVPRLSDGTAVSRQVVLRSFHAVALPDPQHLPYTPLIDATSTIWPLDLGAPLVALVSNVDDTGNEIAGIRLPAVATPDAAFTGWNPRVHVKGLPDVLYEFAGSLLPRQNSQVTTDRASRAIQLKRSAETLVAERFLLAGDVERTIAEGMHIFDLVRAKTRG